MATAARHPPSALSALVRIYAAGASIEVRGSYVPGLFITL